MEKLFIKNRKGACIMTTYLNICYTTIMKNMIKNKYSLLAIMILAFFCGSVESTSARGLNNITTVMTFGNTPGVQIQTESLLQTRTNPSEIPLPNIPSINISAEVATTTLIATSTSGSKFGNNLYFGMKGGDVRLLQTYLNTQGFVLRESGLGSKGSETEYFGPYTRAALIKFQNENGIHPTLGNFGPITREVINSRL